MTPGGRGVSLSTRLRSWPRAVAPLDLPWLLVESDRQPTHVAGVVVLEKPHDAPPSYLDDLCRQMARFDAPTAPFDRRARLHAGLRFWPWWERCPTVRVCDHLHRARVAAPGGRRELERAVAALHRVRLNPDHPLWDVHVLDGLAGNRFAMYARFHHSLVDGVGAIRILQRAFTTDRTRRDMPPVWAYPAGRRTPAAPVRRREQVRALPVALAAAAATFARRRPGKPYSAPACALNTAISSERTVAMLSLDVSRLRAVAATVGGSVNDAFVILCASALRRYLRDIDALPARSLTAAMPVSVRPDGKHAGNALSFAFISLGTDIEDERQRAEHIVASTAQAKGRLGQLGREVVTAYTIATMAPLIVSQMIGLGAVLPPMFNLVVSSVPGPREPLFYNGAALVDIYPVSLLQAGQGLNITALSYEDRLNVTFTACDASLPDVERLTTYCADALEELELRWLPRSRV